jgi:hypothetical protein
MYRPTSSHEVITNSVDTLHLGKNTPIKRVILRTIAQLAHSTKTNWMSERNSNTKKNIFLHEKAV